MRCLPSRDSQMLPGTPICYSNVLHQNFGHLPGGFTNLLGLWMHCLP